ncbi:TPA: recombination protein RecR [bacterium]|jgi:recombination protein RecR|nr:recombination protein RecR [bacterium]
MTASFNKLVSELETLPGIGPKLAVRIAYYIFRSPKETVFNLTQAIIDVKEKVKPCSICFNLTEDDICDICKDQSRDRFLICVVEEPKDVLPIENTHSYNGLYHILMGAIAPLSGIGPKDLTIEPLLKRVREGVKEVIIATDLNVEGETTAIYLSKLLKPLGIKVTRLAQGLPTGSEIEYADEFTLKESIIGRKPI